MTNRLRRSLKINSLSSSRNWDEEPSAAKTNRLEWLNIDINENSTILEKTGRARGSKLIYEGWMVRCGRSKIGRSYIHMRYFTLEPGFLSYYKRRPQENGVPIKTLLIDGNCRVEDRGLKTHQGHMIFVLSVYNKKERNNAITLAAFNIQEALIWKEKIESVIDQLQHNTVSDKHASYNYGSGMDTGVTASSSENGSQFGEHEEEDDTHTNLFRRKTIGNVEDRTPECDSELPNLTANNRAFSINHWRLLKCHNGLRIFEELTETDYLLRSCSQAMKAVGIVKATCEEIFELVMSMDATRFEWDSTFQHGSLVEEVDGHTAILYHRLQLDWFPKFVWPRDLCYIRYWRRNDDGSYVVLFRSREHENCGPQSGYVRAHVESGGFNISPLKPRNGRPRTQVQHLMQIDLKGWGVGYIPSFQQHCLLEMLNNIAGLREWCAQRDERDAHTRIPIMVNMTSGYVSPQKIVSSALMDEYSDEDEEFQITEEEEENNPTQHKNNSKRTVLEEHPVDQIDLSCFSGNLCRDDHDNAHDCWQISAGDNFRVRSKHFFHDRSKVPAGKHLMDLVAVDWFKDTKRMDHVARHRGSAAQVASDKGLFSVVFNLQVPGSTHYSMVFYFVTKELVPGSLLQRFVDGDDEFRNSRFKLLPSVLQGSWIMRQSVGSTPCLLGKAVECNYIRGPKYLEVDVDIGSSAVASGVLWLVMGTIPTLVVDMAFLVQANTKEELPEQLIGAVRVSHIELSSAMVPRLHPDSS
ncbi:protein ENHANCED DISEASE RESISTANCE 2 isoform X3 [Populus alba]|uniref:Pleckstrin-likey domain-containing family protein n=1 Tax=Populus alba TaxID=43335 RepID=A0A4U5N038_POPAL|nr:protein ENHANCED DISEASE RESISTANCE 2-like isoform X2 [Populus alba]TKR75112.1 pleckstrin-likey domain-containing family protein [Populus alba]